MDTQEFWKVIGTYNQETILVQIIILVVVLLALTLSYTGKIKWMAKFVLGITNLFIGIVFFAFYGTEPIQRYFALPLYLIIGVLFLYDSYKNKEDILRKSNIWQVLLLLLYLIYPFVSYLLGNRFPKMVTYIMPCPVVSLSIVVYAGYAKKNVVLLALLTVWGLTGVKSVMFQAYEDIILLLCGIYGLILTIKEINRRKRKV